MYKLHVPIYVQINDNIKLAIMRGQLKPGDVLPSVRDLASQEKVNPNTVQKAFQELERQGLCDTQRGLGRSLIHDLNLPHRLREDHLVEMTRLYIDNMNDAGISLKDVKAYISQLEDTHGTNKK